MDILDNDGSEAIKVARVELSSCAFLDVSTLETQNRLGILAKDLQCPAWHSPKSVTTDKQVSYEANSPDCNPPIKCQ